MHAGLLPCLALCIASTSARAQALPADEEAIKLLGTYIQVDTTNPPGNERRAADFFKAIFDREGIESRIYESAPGRASIVARLKGSGQKKDVVLLNHMDVVPADKSAWKVHPFAGTIQDGYVWGRGAIDMKGMAVIELAAMLALKRSGIPLKADVVFVGTADEEAGGAMGAGYMLREHAELFRNVGTVINEGGSISAASDGSAAYYGVSAAEKTPLWLKLTTTGTPGHGSTPAAQTAVTKLVDALTKIRNWQTPITVVPVVQQFNAATAKLAATPTLQRGQADLAEALKDPAFRDEFLKIPRQNASVRNTIAITMLEGSSKINVIPTRASAQLDVRLLPGQDTARFIEDLKAVMADPTLQVETLVNWPSSESPIDSEFTRLVRRVAATLDPGVPVTSVLTAGFTDCHFFREKDIPCYGFAPFRLTAADLAGFHGNDERVSLANIAFGRKFMQELVERLATE